MTGRPIELHRSFKGEYYLNENAGSGLDAIHVAERDAEQGSRRLAYHCQRLFRSFANHHGIQPNEARILLLDTGVRLLTRNGGNV